MYRQRPKQPVGLSVHVPDAVRILGDAATGTPVLTHSHSVGFPVCLRTADCYQTMREMLSRCANADKVSVTGKGKTPKCGSCGNQSFLLRARFLSTRVGSVL